MPATKTAQQMATVKVSDGTEMNCYVAQPPSNQPCPGILVLQEAFGVNAHIRDVADRLAREGYVAIAPELYHRTGPGFEGDYNNFPGVAPHMQAMTVGGAEADLKAAFQWLQSQSNVRNGEVVCVGFCMGGRMSFLANSALPLKAAASFYGGQIAPGLLDRAASLHAPQLMFWGEQDAHIPPEQRAQVIQALKAAKKTYVNVEFSDAGHGFFCDARGSYVPRAARQAWALLLEFLRS